MIPVHPTQAAGRYSNSNPMMYGTQHHTAHPQQPPMTWRYVPGHFVPQVAFPQQQQQQQQQAPFMSMPGPSSLAPLPAPPSMNAISKVPNASSRSIQSQSQPVPPATTSAKAAPAPAGTKQRDIEAAEVLLGLTSKDGAGEKEGTTATDTAASSKKRRAASIGHVTDESSTGTCSRTNSPCVITSMSSNSNEQASSSSVPTLDASGKWYSGSISLSLQEDDDVLSPLHCFMRKYCVEAFSATAQDVATPRYGKSHGFKVEVGQVGIRCLYCKNLPVGKRPERAVCYPSSLRNIYHSIETWQRRHSLVCTHISPWVRKSIMELMESSKTRAGGRRQYWEASAQRLGMIDTPHGVRFMRPPGDLGPVAEAGESGDNHSSGNNSEEAVVREEDKDLVTEYLYLLMEQMQTCRFTEEDRTGGRSKIKDISLNFPGYECRHCHGRAGFGRYFPSSVSALSLANSDRNVFNHLQKCRRCPAEIKHELIRLSKEQAKSKNRRGLRKLFFNRIWDRMHGPKALNPPTANAVTSASATGLSATSV